MPDDGFERQQESDRPQLSCAMPMIRESHARTAHLPSIVTGESSLDSSGWSYFVRSIQLPNKLE